MPLGSKRSRNAKQKRDYGCAAFAKCATSPPSTDESDYSAPESNPDASTTEAEYSNDSEAGDQAVTPVEEIQRLYSVFLPPYLRAKERTRQNLKHRKIANRRSVYTRDSRTTAWQKNAAQKKAAQGCATLDAFIMRRVSCYEATKTRHIIEIRSDSIAVHQLRSL